MPGVTNGPVASGGAPRSERVQGGNGSSHREETAAVLALLFLLAVTFAWWLTALWPPSGNAPQWVRSVRAVCFGSHPDGLPDAGGWILLVGEPIGMAAALYVIWGEPLLRGLHRLAVGAWGRGFLAVVGSLLLVGASAAAYRVASASSPSVGYDTLPEAGVIDPIALSGMAPELGLIDHRGDTISISHFRGTPLLVTFAFGQCETVCPLLVHDAMSVRAQLGDAAPSFVVITLDPWRDTVHRLSHIARTWQLDDSSYLLGGEIDQVRDAHSAWKVAAIRDPRTGDITHPPLTYVVDSAGRLAYLTDGSPAQLTRALAELSDQ